MALGGQIRSILCSRSLGGCTAISSRQVADGITPPRVLRFVTRTTVKMHSSFYTWTVSIKRLGAPGSLWYWL